MEGILNADVVNTVVKRLLDQQNVVRSVQAYMIDGPLAYTKVNHE